MDAKILLLDIETSPLIVYSWDLFNQITTINQINTDWSILSWSAKWLGSKEVLYQDQRYSKDLRDDKKLCRSIWELIDKADIVVGQNSKKFDIKKLNARFIINGLHPPSSFKHVDTYQIAKKKFGFTSNKLEYLSDKLCPTYKKLKHEKFPGFDLWKECLKGNISAWKEMERYNKQDVLALEELYRRLSPWDNSVNYSLYSPIDGYVCSCGSTSWYNNGFHYTPVGKFRRYRCKKCGAEGRSNKNLINKDTLRKL